MGFKNSDNIGVYGDNGIGIINAAIDQTTPVQNPPPASQQPTPPAPSQTSSPVQAPAQQPTPPQPAAQTPQASTTPAAQPAKPATASTDAEESELDTLLLKGDLEKVKTVKVAENTFIRIYAKKSGSPSAQPRPVTQPQPTQQQPQPAQPRPAVQSQPAQQQPATAAQPAQTAQQMPAAAKTA